MHILKAVMFPLLAVGSALALLLAMGKPWEKQFLKGGVIGAFFIKIAGCVLLYTLKPSLIRYSDARSFYLPQTLRLLSGEVPNRDFVSSYSFLFTPVLATPVKLWPSPGSIALEMILVETAMLWIYIARCRREAWDGGWRVAFLYALSPFSCYWVAVSGHNGVLIAFWVMLSLVLAERGRAALAGIAAALAFLTAKVLALLAWPGLVLFDREKRLARLLPLCVSLAAVASLSLAGVDSLGPLRGELRSSTHGNIWHIIGIVAPAIRGVVSWPYLPILAFLVFFVPMCVLFLRAYDRRYRFDRGAAFVAATFLLFLALSRKGFSTYLIMGLPFVIHAIFRSGHPRTFPMLFLILLEAIGFIEESHGGDSFGVFLIDGARIVSYAALFVFCFTAAVRESAENAQPAFRQRDPQENS
ncbi:MAG: hypothetical protein PHD74_06120 [Candidatus Krumholzibacteria bacterium]|nr:hypothetical protein [Candidatus Krumholzibacteria bacterium]